MSDDKDAGSWWKTIPGILTGIGSTLAALAALVAALSQAGLLGAKKTVADSVPASSVTATASVAAPSVPAATATATVAVEPPATAGTLLVTLARANVRNSVGNAVMQRWLDETEGGYHRLAQACLRLLDGRSLSMDGADLDVVNALYLKAAGFPDGADMPADHPIRKPLLQSALIGAYNDKNGTRAHALGAITK
jgi:hypothetical protein